MKNVSYSEAKALAGLFFPVTRAFLRLMHGSRMVPAGLTPQQMKIVMELSMADTMRLSDLSRCAAVTHGTMTVAVQKLLKKGLVVKKKDPRDERAVSLALTAGGKAVARQITSGTEEMFQAICGEISRAERQKLVTSYQFLLKTYQKIVARKGA